MPKDGQPLRLEFTVAEDKEVCLSSEGVEVRRTTCNSSFILAVAKN